MFQTNSPVARMLAVVSLSLPSVRELAQTITVGGSQVRFWNWLYGARLWTPSALMVDSQPIGRGTQQDLNGLKGRPELWVAGV